MAKILCVDDFVQYAEMVAMYLATKGKHQVKTEIVPFNLDEIRRYQPDLIVIGIVRKMEHVKEPITDFYTQVDGAKALRELLTNPETSGVPLVVASVAVQEVEVPRDLGYLAFIEVPSKFDNLIMVIDHILKAKGHAMAPE